MLGATTLSGFVELQERAISDLRKRLSGPLVVCGDAGYDEARTIWNRMIDRRPALIARCAGTDDVVTALRFAREHGLLISVRGGGHNVTGNAVCDGGLMIDLSPMKSARVDPRRRRMTAEPGLTWKDFDTATLRHGLATTGGIVSSTGVAGLTLGGGHGWLMRKHGLACDNVSAVDVVVADGRCLRASADENPELFWGCEVAAATSASSRRSSSNSIRSRPCWRGSCSFPGARPATSSISSASRPRVHPTTSRSVY